MLTFFWGYPGSQIRQISHPGGWTLEISTSYPHLSRKLLNCIYCTNPFKYENSSRKTGPDGNPVPIDGFKRFPGAGSEKFTEEAKGVYRRNYRLEGQDFQRKYLQFCCAFQPSTSLKKLAVSQDSRSVILKVIYTPENEHDIGKSPFSIGNMSSFMVFSQSFVRWGYPRIYQNWLAVSTHLKNMLVKLEIISPK